VAAELNSRWNQKRQWLQVALAVRNPAVHFFARPPRGIHGFTLQPPVFQHCHSHVSFEVLNIGVKFFMGRELFLPRPQSVNVFFFFLKGTIGECFFLLFTALSLAAP